MGTEVKCWCKHCGIELPSSHTGPCPKCGKSGKDCEIVTSDSGEAYERTRLRQKRKGFSKFMKEILRGWFKSGDLKLKKGKYKGIYKVRIIDKEKDEYHEVVKNAETGEITREVHEQLSQHRHSNHNWTWWSFFSDRARQLFSRLWKLLATYSVGILVFSGFFYILALVYSNGEVLSVEASGALGLLNSIFAAAALGIAVAGFLLAFLVLFALSLLPKGRRLADRAFGFSKITELEKFKNKVDDELAIINKRLGNVEKRLDNFENTIQKSKEQEDKTMGSKGRKNVKKPKKAKEPKGAQQAEKKK